MSKSYIDGVIGGVSNKPGLKSSGSKISYGSSNKMSNASAYTDTGTGGGSAKGARSGVRTTMTNPKKKSKISTTGTSTIKRSIKTVAIGSSITKNKTTSGN